MIRIPIPTASLEKKRLANIELLRIAAMFMIVLLHCNIFGGLLENTQPLTWNWFAVWTVESLSIVAVNCYVFISGYFFVESRFRLRKLVKIWVQIFFLCGNFVGRAGRLIWTHQIEIDHVLRAAVVI